MIIKNGNLSNGSNDDFHSDTSSILSPIDNDSNNREMTDDELRRHVIGIRKDHSTGKNILYPELHSHTIDEWVTKFETDLQIRHIPLSQWSEAVILFLTGSGKVDISLRERRNRRLQSGMQQWSWEEFKTDLYEVLVEIENEPSYFQKFQQDYPNVTTAVKITAGTGLMIAGSTVLVPSLGVAALNGIGFTASGVAAGSIATGIQSIVYGGATTGLFSVCQSIGATAVVASGSAITSSIGAVAAGASILGFGKGKPDLKPVGLLESDGSDGPSTTSDAPPPYQP